MGTQKGSKAIYSFVYNKRNKLSKKGTAILHLEVYLDRNNRKFINTDLNLTPEQWDDKKKLVTNKYQSYIHANLYLKNLLNSIEEFEFELLNSGKQLTIKLIDDFINNDLVKESFQQFMKKELDADNSLTEGSYKHINYSINLLSEFKPNIKFSEINYDLIQEFDRFLRNYQRKGNDINEKKVGLMQNTIKNHHKNVSRFVRIAVKKGLIKYADNPYLHFKSKTEASSRVNLTFEELAKLEAHEIGIAALNEVRDMFLFSCYTGLRFSDMQALQPGHIVEYNEGLSIKFKMEKVSRPIEIPTHLLFEKKPEKILKAYLALKREFIFPRITDVHINRQLKIIAGSIGITKPISFHCARHTFGTLIADITGNPFVIKELMGHQTIETSMIYIHSSKEMINRQLRKTSWKLD